MGKLVFQSKRVSDKAKQSSGTVDIGIGDGISTFSGGYGGGYRLPDSARHTMIFAGIVALLGRRHFTVSGVK